MCVYEYDVLLPIIITLYALSWTGLIEVEAGNNAWCDVHAIGCVCMRSNYKYVQWPDKWEKKKQFPSNSKLLKLAYSNWKQNN